MIADDHDPERVSHAAALHRDGDDEGRGGGDRHGAADGHAEERQDEHDERGHKRPRGDDKALGEGVQHGLIDRDDGIAEGEHGVGDQAERIGQRGGLEHPPDVAVEIGLRQRGDEARTGRGRRAAVAEVDAGEDDAGGHPDTREGYTCGSWWWRYAGNCPDRNR